MSKLINLIDQLSKSSPNAVFTLKSISDVPSDDIYNYIYIETQIEKDYKSLLGEYRKSKVIIFLCGSSGDGKSAIIGKNHMYFEKYYDIHIDATHSFKPEQTAVEALDEVFRDFKSSNKSLVVGINMGVLLNYAREGCDEHNDIKEKIKIYGTTHNDSIDIKFINFEDYPKFEMHDGKITSTFISSLLQKISNPSVNNPFFTAFQSDLDQNIRYIDHQNFYLLGLEPIQNKIIELLVTVHLKYDQFLTTRSILDLIYVLLRDPRLLIDQLFESDSNTILENTQKEDPILFRTQHLDTFILERSNNKKDEALEEFVRQFNEKSGFQILQKNDVHTLVRTFYLFREFECCNNYHQRFNNDFMDSSTLQYVKLIYANQNYSQKTKRTLQAFYKKIKKAIFTYANKHNPSLSSKELFQVDSINGYAIATPLEITPVWSHIERNKKHNINNFQCFLKVGESSIEPFSVSLNMYKLILAINNGYRPNKHDRNTIIIFDEVLDKISSKLKTSRKLFFIKDNQYYEFRNSADEIEVHVHD